MPVSKILLKRISICDSQHKGVDPFKHFFLILYGIFFIKESELNLKSIFEIESAIPI